MQWNTHKLGYDMHSRLLHVHCATSCHFFQQRVAQGMQAHVMPTSSICHSMMQQTAGQLFNKWVEPHIPLGSVARWVQHKWGGTDRTVSVVG